MPIKQEGHNGRLTYSRELLKIFSLLRLIGTVMSCLGASRAIVKNVTDTSENSSTRPMQSPYSQTWQ